MHGHLPHNPLDDAARKVDDVARRTKSPGFERAAIYTMIASAVMTTALAALQAFHIFKREIRDEQRGRERDQRAAAPPPERPGYDGAATAGMPDHDRGDGEPRRWTRREEHAEAAARGRQR